MNVMLLQQSTMFQLQQQICMMSLDHRDDRVTDTSPARKWIGS